MKKTAVVLLMVGMVVLCGCENKQLKDAQAQNAQLKADAEKAKADSVAAEGKVTQMETKLAEMKKKDQETQTQALNSIRTMLEKQDVKTKELNAKIAQQGETIKQKDSRIKVLEGQLAEMKAVAKAAAKEAQKAAEQPAAQQ